MAVEANGNNLFGTPAYFFSTTPTETVFPMYDGSTFPAKYAMNKSDSGLTYNLPVSRKRYREKDSSSVNYLLSSHQCHTNTKSTCFTFLGEDISSHIHQQQYEIDRFIAHHTEKVRIEIEERRKRYCRRIAATIEEIVTSKLKSKDEEIERMTRLNWSLEEKVKSLCTENQIWRDLAQTNEATANALRYDLEQLMNDQRFRVDETRDDEESCCGSNEDNYIESKNFSVGRKMCKGCGKEEARVLVLPCRHLCLCGICGSTVHTCPVCFSVKTASVCVSFE